jgi:transposase
MRPESLRERAQVLFRKGLPVRMIAERLKVPQPTVRTWISQARKP